MFDIGAMDAHFTMNMGQVEDRDVLFYALGTTVSVALYSDHLRYVVGTSLDGGEAPSSITVSFEGCRKVTPIGRDGLEHRSNYFRSSDPDRWLTSVRNFASVEYQDIYDGIDLVFRLDGGYLKYEFRVAAGTDPSPISMTISGADALEVDPGTGDLLVSTGGRVLRDGAPVAFQPKDGGNREVEASYRLQGDRVGFELGHYTTSEPLVIDPWLRFSTFIGPGYGSDIAVDHDGFIYVTGATGGTDFLITPGAYDTQGGASYDAFVAKLRPDGSALVYSTFVGINAWDGGLGIDVDPSGCAYITGRTTGPEFPTTPGAFDTTHNGKDDAFLVKLNADGSDLVYSTLLGSDNYDKGCDIDVDDEGFAYVIGNAGNQTFPTTPGAYDTTYNDKYAGNYDRDAFVLKMDKTGSAPVYSTFLGSQHTDEGIGIDVDDSGHAYVTGHSGAIIPTTPGAYNITGWGTFMTKLSPDGSALEYSANLGDNDVMDIWVDQEGCAHVTGSTDSEDFPTTEGAFDRVLCGSGDCFVSKLSADGSSILLSTLLGGSRGEHGAAIHGCSSGGVYILGKTSSDDFPYVPGSYCSTKGYTMNGFVTWLSADLSEVLYSTYIPASGHVFVGGLVADDEDRIYVVGEVEADDFPLTEGALKDYRTYKGGREVYVFRADDLVLPRVWDDGSDTYASTGEGFDLLINASDNQGIERVQVHYAYEDHEPDSVDMTAMDVDGEGNGRYGCTITVPSGTEGPLKYYFRAESASGEVGGTAAVTLPVHDNDRPTFGPDLTASEAIRGLDMELAVEVEDNVALRQVNCSIYLDGELEENGSMRRQPGVWRMFLPVPRSFMGTITYHFSAMDAAGNWNRTENVTVTPVNAPPELDVERNWTVVEESASHFDIAANVSDPNDPFANITMELEDDRVEVEGYLISINLSVWEPDFILVLTFSDGEDEVQYEVRVHVVPVNDLPVVHNALDGPFSVLEDEPFSFAFNATDEDGDTLTWYDNTSLFEIDRRAGTIEFTPTQDDVGEHSVKVELWDANVSLVEMTLRFVVVAVNDPPVIGQLAPPSNSTFDLGENVSFAAQVFDAEGDELYCVWTEGLTVLGTGRTVTVSNLTVGRHLVTLSVDDGNATVTKTIVVEVREEDGNGDGDDGIGYPALPLVAAAILLVAFLVSLSRRAR